jgi:hypothetical protein
MDAPSSRSRAGTRKAGRLRHTIVPITVAVPRTCTTRVRALRFVMPMALTTGSRGGGIRLSIPAFKGGTSDAADGGDGGDGSGDAATARSRRSWTARARRAGPGRDAVQRRGLSSDELSDRGRRLLAGATRARTIGLASASPRRVISAPPKSVDQIGQMATLTVESTRPSSSKSASTGGFVHGHRPRWPRRPRRSASSGWPHPALHYVKPTARVATSCRDTHVLDARLYLTRGAAADHGPRSRHPIPDNDGAGG